MERGTCFPFKTRGPITFFFWKKQVFRSWPSPNSKGFWGNDFGIFGTQFQNYPYATIFVILSVSIRVPHVFLLWENCLKAFFSNVPSPVELRRIKKLENIRLCQLPITRTGSLSSPRSPSPRQKLLFLQANDPFPRGKTPFPRGKTPFPRREIPFLRGKQGAPTQ